MKKRLTAAFLAFIGGTFGLHKFYLRESSAGIFYMMLFFITSNLFSFPVTMILGFIDGIQMLSMSDERFNKKYNADYYQRRTRHARDNKNRPVQRKPTQNPYERPTQARTKVNPFKKSGLNKYKEFDIDEAISDFTKGLEIEPKDVSLHFNLACAYSLNEEKEKSYHHLQKAVENGLKETNKILEHDDLAFIRIQPEFEAFKAASFKQTAQSNKKLEETSVPNDQLLAQLNKLDELRKKGLLADNEYLLEKEKLLRS